MGKSTLSERLRSRLELDGEINYLHKSMPQELNRRWVLTDYVLDYEYYMPGSPVSLLADRWHYGEFTYAPIYRPETNSDGFGLLGVAGWRWVEMFLMSRGALVVRLDAADEVLIQRLHDRGDDHIKNTGELLAVAERYRNAAPFSPSTDMTIDTSYGEQVDVDPIWFKALQMESLSAEVLGICPEYIGNLRPDVLLVGDHRNVTKTYGNETMLPFMPVNASSGVYLLESLGTEFWTQVGMINGNDTVGNIRTLWEVLGRPRPVALGRKAQSALTSAGFMEIEFTVLDHPAYTRRFHHSTQSIYGQDITNAAIMKGTYA